MSSPYVGLDLTDTMPTGSAYARRMPQGLVVSCLQRCVVHFKDEEGTPLFTHKPEMGPQKPYGDIKMCEPAQEDGIATGHNGLHEVPTCRPGAAARHRLEMVRLAVADNPGLGVSDVEVTRRGASYSIDTVRHFAAALDAKDDLYLILGLDAFLLMGSWKDWRELLALTHVIVTSRPGSGDALPYEKIPIVVREAFCYDPVRSGFRNEFGKELLFKRLTDVSVSASAIRELLGKGKSIRHLVPAEVQRYVKEQHLYNEPTEC